MSMQVYESDYMSVVGEIGEYSNFKLNEVQEGQEGQSTHYIHLFFSVQVNGKLRTFPLKFDLADNKNEIVKDECLFKLKNYTDWYNVYETLKGMGYGFGDESRYSWNGVLINEWIVKLSESCNR